MRLGVVWLLAGAFLLSARTARADEVESWVNQLFGSGGYKVRLGAALSLSKVHDARAVVALARALEQDEEANLRRVAALALARIVDGDTPQRVRERARTALAGAARGDRDGKVRETAARALQELGGGDDGASPAVFINVGNAADLTRKAPADAARQLEVAVRSAVKRTAPGYAVEWPGGLPTAQQLTTAGASAFYVGATVAVVDVAKKSGRTEVACTVAIRVAPWAGKDGHERWREQEAASAQGSGKAITGGSDAAVAGGIRDCIAAVGEELTSRQVVPFIKRLIATP